MRPEDLSNILQQLLDGKIDSNLKLMIEDPGRFFICEICQAVYHGDPDRQAICIQCSGYRFSRNNTIVRERAALALKERGS